MTAIIKLKSSDDQVFQVDIKVAKMSTTIREMLENLGEPEEGNEEDVPIPVQVEADILKMVIKWAEYHQKLEENGNGSSSEGNGVSHHENDDEEVGRMSEWNQEFFKVENNTLYAITRAANFLDMKGLLDVCCESVANLIRGKTPRQIRELFGLPWPTVEKKEKVKTKKGNEVEKRG